MNEMVQDIDVFRPIMKLRIFRKSNCAFIMFHWSQIIVKKSFRVINKKRKGEKVREKKNSKKYIDIKKKKSASLGKDRIFNIF